MTGRIVQFVSILLVALVTGVYWGTWFTLTRSLESFSASEFLQIGKTIIANVAVPMRILLPASLLGMALTIWLYPLKRSAGFYLVLVALGLLIATLLITLLVEVPIDNEIREWTVLTLPSDWEQTRLTWKRFHAFRTATSVGSLAALVLGILLSSERRRLAPHTAPAVV